MKAWGWISMKTSLGDALKNTFEEATMKNMPIDQFRSFKWRNGVQNWNLHEKLNISNNSYHFDIVLAAVGNAITTDKVITRNDLGSSSSIFSSQPKKCENECDDKDEQAKYLSSWV